MTNQITVVLSALCVLAGIASTTSAAHIRQWPSADRSFEAVNDFDMEGFVANNITQRVDHFNAQNSATFEQQYFEHTVNYTAGGPIIILVGGEDFLLYPYQLNSSLALHLAVEQSGAAFHLEQRYYGYSQPAADLSTANMRYLTVDQSLADLAHFIDHVKASLPGADESKVLVVGRNFGGSLALWFRQSYPHLCDGAFVAGSPLLGKLNHFEFHENIGETMLSAIGQQCYDDVSQAFTELDGLAEEAIQTGEYTQLNTVLNSCNESMIEGPADVAMKYRWLSDLVSSVSSYRPNAEEMCANLQVRNETIQQALHGLIAYVNEWNYGNCYWTYKYSDYVNSLSETTLNSVYTRYGDRQSLYEQCTQYGWFATTDSERQPFGRMIPLSFYTQLCVDVFGADAVANAAENVERFNVERGGLRPRVSHVLFTNGEFDPFRSLMVREEIGHEVVVRQLANSTWSVDFAKPRYYDSDDVAEIKQLNLATLRSWL